MPLPVSSFHLVSTHVCMHTGEAIACTEMSNVCYTHDCALDSIATSKTSLIRDGVWRTVYMYMYGVWKDGESYTHNECLRLLIHHTYSPVHVPCVVGSVQRGEEEERWGYK